MDIKDQIKKLQFIPALWQGFWAYQIIGDKIIVQQYIKDGCRKEFFGHRYIVNFDNETLTPQD